MAIGSEARAQGYVEMQEGWTASLNFTETKLFYDRVESWKYDARFAQTNGQPIPPAPKIPTLLTVDQAKARQAYLDWEVTGEWRFDFYISNPLQVPEGTLEFIPKPIAQPDESVSFPDEAIPGTYLVAQGDRHKAGDIINHPKYGRLVMVVHNTPFGSSSRWYSLK